MDHLLCVEECKRQKSQFSLLLQIGSFLRIFVERREKSSIDRMKTVTSERCNTHTLNHSVKGIIPKVINMINNHIPH